MPPDFHLSNEERGFLGTAADQSFPTARIGAVPQRSGPTQARSYDRSGARGDEEHRRSTGKEFPTRNKGRGVRVEPLHDALFGGMRRPLWMLEGVVAFVLLIACANVAGLQLARGATRQTEVAVRAALGAGRWRIVRQFLVESVLLSLVGGALGALLAWAGLRLLIAISPPWFPLLQHIGIDGWVLAFTAALSVFCRASHSARFRRCKLHGRIWSTR